MPTQRFDQDVFAAGGTAATDWGHAGGNAQIALAAGAQIDRGINLDLSLQALANVDAGVGKFLSAEVSGQASAVASVTAQIQAPMNLFKEVGFAVRLQAIAELAAAVQVSLGLKFQDFLDLAQQDPQMRGLPIELLRVFLSEITVKGGLYAKAALTAQAYAQLVVTGTAIAQPALNIKPGFNIVAGVGAGLKAGAGFRVFAAMEFDDFSRFVARSVDVLVDNACSQAKAALPDADPAMHELLDAARPAFKIAFRTAYELGEYIAKNAPAANAAGSQNVAMRCTQVVLEEGQRFLLNALADAAFEALRVALRGWLALTPRAQWDAALPARRAFADHLRALPPEPFNANAANETWWNELITRLINVATAMLGSALDFSTLRAVAVLWSAVQLALVASRRVTRADASLSVIGQPPQQARAAFTGTLSAQPPTVIRNHIRASLSPAPSGNLKLDHLVEFLVADAVLDFLRQKNPGADRFLSAMTGPLGDAANKVARTILRNIGSVIAGGSGQLDAQASLAAISSALRQFMSDQIHQELAPVLRAQLPAPELKTYFDEVFLPTTDFTLGTVFGVVLDWTQRGADKDRLVEALSGVLMKLVGRSLVVTADIMMATAQAQLQDILGDLADNVDAPNGIVQELSRHANLPVPVSEIAELTADALRIGAEVLGPLTDGQRAKIRSLMYVVIDPLPLGADAGFLQQLSDPGMIPNDASMRELATELATLGAERFLMFVGKLIKLIGTKMLEELAELLDAAQHQLKQWVDDAQRALEDMQRALGQLVAEIERLGREVAERFDDAAEDLLAAFAPLATSSGRNKFKSKLAGEIIDDTLAVLTDNDVYRNIAPPSFKSTMRSMARNAVEEALDNDVVDTVLDILGEVAEELDSIMDDVRELDPDRDLAEQVGNLLINRMSDAIYDSIGRDPHINVGFDVTIFGVGYRVSLGRIDVPVEALVDGMRQAVRALDAFADAVRAAAAALASAFAGEQQLRDAEANRADIAARRERLSRQRGALVTAPRGLRILSPAPGGVVTGTAKLRIEVQGLAPDAALDDDTPASVHVFLNGRELPLAGFTLAQLGGTTATAPGLARPDGLLQPGALVQPGRYDALGELDLKPARPGGLNGKGPTKGLPRGGANKLASAALKGPARKTERFPFTSAGAQALAASRGKASPALAAVRAAATTTSAAAAAATARASTPASTASAALAAASAAGAVRPGKSVPPALPRRSERRFGAPLTVTQVTRLAGQSAGGVILTRTLLGAELEEGLNTLVVSIAPPDGPRVESSCAFFVEAAAAQPAPPKPGQVRLPVVIPRKPADLKPQKAAGKFLLRPKAERAKIVEAQKKVVSERLATKQSALLATAFPTTKLAPLKVAPDSTGRIK
jgi:hypothetical protein